MSRNIKTESEHSDRLFKDYGELLTLSEVATILRFPSAEAVRKAISRGTLVLKPIKINNRRRIYVKTEEIVKYLNSL